MHRAQKLRHIVSRNAVVLVAELGNRQLSCKLDGVESLFVRYIILQHSDVFGAPNLLLHKTPDEM